MDFDLQRIFLFQIQFQCESLLRASEDANIQLRKSPSEGVDVSALFCALQNILTAAANLSKALWGQKGPEHQRRSTERKPLRDRLGVSDTSPLYDYVMRNNFEHFDERLERWWQTSKTRGYADLCIGPPSEFVQDDIDRFRVFDPSTNNMLFWGQTFNLQSLLGEAKRILPIVREETLRFPP